MPPPSHLIAHVRVVELNGKLWWWCFTEPLVYSVYWLPDDSKSLVQFRDEQVALIRQHINELKAASRAAYGLPPRHT